MDEDLVEFIRAQLDIDQRVAGEAESLAKWNAVHGASEQDPSGVYMYMGYMYLDYRVFEGRRGDVEHAARWDPPGVLREVEAKRQRVDWLVGLQHDNGWESFVTYDSCRILAKPGDLGDLEVGYCSCGLDAWRDRLYRIEALPYVDRPGYREEWRP